MPYWEVRVHSITLGVKHGDLSVPKIDKKSGLMTTEDSYKILFHGHQVDVSKNDNKISLNYEMLVGGSAIIYKDPEGDNEVYKELLNVLEKALSEMKFDFEIS
jgi:hypothetical protein